MIYMERAQKLHQLLALSFFFIVGCIISNCCIVDERDALLNFVMRSLIQHQHILSQWNDEDCCIWKGVICNNTTGHIIELRFAELCTSFPEDLLTCPLYATSLDPSLFLLKHLQVLGLRGIDFNGTRIPQSMSALTNIRSLDFGHSRFVGVIPPFFGNLTNLWYLDLGGNDLTSPNLLWISGLSSLSSLNMSGVNLTYSTNWLHEIIILPNLTLLDLSGCNLQTLPNLLPYSNFSSRIDYLDLSGNQFSTSRIPCWLSNMTNLEFLILSNNIFQNTIIPECIAQLRHLTGLFLQNNHIIGHLPRSFGQLTKLYELDLSFNLLHGSLLDVNFLNLSQLRHLNLQSNILKGRLPRLNSNINTLIMSNNKFSMEIEWFLNQNISNLDLLALAQNNLFGQIPVSICKLKFYMGTLDLSNNNLIGEIPKCPSNFNSLWFMSLANNNLEGLIPQWMENTTSLNYLSLRNNNFQGDISFLKNSTNLIGLDLGQNNFTGAIPSWIGDRFFLLKFLSLRSNKFSGTIPSQFSKLQHLQILDLAYNSLSGTLPKVSGFLNATTNIVIPRSYLWDFLVGIQNGKYVPWKIYIKGMELEYTTTLSLVTLLDLSYNNFIGEIPTELTSLLGLQSLNLSGNQFTGQIPISISAMQMLETLDLSMNDFSGEIPLSLLKLNQLSHFNLSYNQLSGGIPKGGQFDTFDNSTYYGNQDLCGIPLEKSCIDDDTSFVGNSNDGDEDDTFDLYVGMGLGFIVGIWGVVGMLLLKRSWATTYFRFYDNLTNNIHVFMVVKRNQAHLRG